jgi:hypothetical protein
MSIGETSCVVAAAEVASSFTDSNVVQSIRHAGLRLAVHATDLLFFRVAVVDAVEQDKPLPLDLGLLASRAEAAHALAKLLHYREQEYLRDTEEGDSNSNSNAQLDSTSGDYEHHYNHRSSVNNGYGRQRRRTRGESMASIG